MRHMQEHALYNFSHHSLTNDRLKSSNSSHYVLANISLDAFEEISIQQYLVYNNIFSEETSVAKELILVILWF